MINVRAFAVLLSSLAAVVFLSPEPTIRRVSNEFVIVEAAPSPAESAKKATEDVVNTASDYAQRTGEGIRHVGSAAYDKLTGAKDSVKSAAHHSTDKVAEGAARVKGAAVGASDSACDHLGDAAYATGDAAYATGDWVKSCKHDQHEEPGKLHGAANKLKERLHEAVQYQPNIGEGLGYYTDGHGVASSSGSSKEEAVSSMQGYIDSAKNSAMDAINAAAENLGYAKSTARDAMDSASDQIGHFKQDADRKKDEIPPTVESARRNIAEYYDSTKASVLHALQMREKELGHSLESARQEVEGYYEKAKETAMASVENQKGSLEHYLDVVVQKLNAGRDAVLHYALSTVNHGKEAVNHGKAAVSHGKDVVVEESKKGMDKTYEKVHEIEQEASKWGSSAKGKVNQTLRQAGRWAHDKMVKLNETEEMALAMCKQWIQKSVFSVVRLLHLFVFSSVYGSALWVTFISGFALARSITRHQFGIVQSKIFPVYFRVLGSGIALLLATHTVLHPFPSAGISEMLQYYNLGGCLAFTLLNTFFLEPQATKSMFEKLRLEKEEGRSLDGGHVPVADERTRGQMESTNRKLNQLHRFSSAANLVVLVGLTWHLWYLNCRLVI